MDFEQGYHEWMGKANLWWIKQSLSQVPSGQNVCRPYCIYLSLECIRISVFFLSVCLTFWHSSVCSYWSASGWCMRSKGHPSCSPGKNPHDGNRKRSKLGYGNHGYKYMYHIKSIFSTAYFEKIILVHILFK